MDCGPSCLRMIARYYGATYSLAYLRDICNYSMHGVSLQGISRAAEFVGFRTMCVSLNIDKFVNEAPLPLIAHWNQKHFVVVYKISKDTVFIADPAHGKVKYTLEEFKKGWVSNFDDNIGKGIAMLLEPGQLLKQDDKEESKVVKYSTRLMLRYAMKHKKLIVQLGIGMIVASLLQLMLPFLTQAIVDLGVNYQDLDFIYIILIAQSMLTFSRGIVDFIRGWILLYIGQHINISMLSDFLFKLMKMPIAYFDTKKHGDILQRINDQSRIESFLTNTLLSLLLSVFNLIVFGIVLAIYSYKIFFVFLFGSLIYVGWMILFLRHRRALDYKRFNRMRQNQDALFQIINGMQEIKLHNCETNMRWEWERIQAKLFKISVESLKLSQFQRVGALFFNEGKNIFITFLAAVAVINGEMSLGIMLSIQYILGQLNAPVDQLVQFVTSAQDARISMERLSEISGLRDEIDDEIIRVHDFPANKDIQVKNLSFHYPGMNDSWSLDNISFSIPEGKVTAIVGMSGSGKTTLIKLLLGFYAAQKGEIQLGNQKLLSLSQRKWRDKCGVVMQDGYIFSDTIERNIALGEENIDQQKLRNAVSLACIQSFIESLPIGYKTKIGANGQGISSGQKQRILIARAIYKNPEYLFFDEATNALDANNERMILENMNKFFNGRTVVVVAHRLSTVRNADNIIVMSNGKIIETGTHAELTELKGEYFNLVKNQLELAT